MRAFLFVSVVLCSTFAAGCRGGHIGSKTDPGAVASCSSTVNLTTDAANCGACGKACLGSQTCSAGQCGCAAPLADVCSGAVRFCTSLQNDADNCGSCGNVCRTLCSNGSCVASGALTTDILFVVDDSPSMASKQQVLADNFDQFLSQLTLTNKTRVAVGKLPFEFHVAVTTTSVFRNYAAGEFSTKYEPALAGCTVGVAVAGAPYPRGDFVAAPGNFKVLHFTSDLFASNAPALADLTRQFKGNVAVGTCGSRQEQPLQAARLALQKVIGGAQTIPPGEFGHPGAKLIVVVVSDEDDCSSPESAPILLASPESAGHDECVIARDSHPEQLYATADFMSFLVSLVGDGSTQHPYKTLGTAFVVSSVRCSDGSCAPADGSYLPAPATCTGSPQYACDTAYGAGVRHLQLATALKRGGYSVLESSVCESFGGPLVTALTDLVSAP